MASVTRVSQDWSATPARACPAGARAQPAVVPARPDRGRDAAAAGAGDVGGARRHPGPPVGSPARNAALARGKRQWRGPGAGGDDGHRPAARVLAQPYRAGPVRLPRGCRTNWQRPATWTWCCAIPRARSWLPREFPRAHPCRRFRPRSGKRTPITGSRPRVRVGRLYQRDDAPVPDPRHRACPARHRGRGGCRLPTGDRVQRGRRVRIG